MSAAQTIASNRFITAMGSMIEDEKKMNAVFDYIEYLKLQPLYPPITQDELDRNSMPLHQAMDKLREKARSDEYIPTDETLAAMKEARSGKLKTYASVNEMMNDILG